MGTGAIHNPRSIIDEDPSNYRLQHTKGDAIHNPREIIDERPIYNVPNIMDQNGASIIQGAL